MARNYLTVDGVNLSTYGVYISGQGTFSAPQKEVQMYNVPGRDGAVLSSLSRLQNVEVTYPCFIYANVKTNLRNLRSFLLSRSGYVQISDTYHPSEFRHGTYLGPFEPTMTLRNDAAQFDLTFSCKPQRYLTNGQVAIDCYVGNTAFTNPTRFPAKPLLRVYGTNDYSGGISISPASVLFPNMAIEFASEPGTPYVDIDCETMQCYYGSTNLNSCVNFLAAGLYGADAPILAPGVNNVTIWQASSVPPPTGAITQVDITPRWWEV